MPFRSGVQCSETLVDGLQYRVWSRICDYEWTGGILFGKCLYRPRVVHVRSSIDLHSNQRSIEVIYGGVGGLGLGAKVSRGNASAIENSCCRSTNAKHLLIRH